MDRSDKRFAHHAATAIACRLAHDQRLARAQLSIELAFPVAPGRDSVRRIEVEENGTMPLLL
jgi:hypothetical protein